MQNVAVQLETRDALTGGGWDNDGSGGAVRLHSNQHDAAGHDLGNQVAVEHVAGGNVGQTVGAAAKANSEASRGQRLRIQQDLAGQQALHLGRALQNGVTRAELGELIMHTAIYGGFPVAVEGMRIAREVFDAEDAGSA